MSIFFVQGRSVDEEHVTWLQKWIADHPEWSRKRLARELCQLWNWRDRLGQVKDFAARSFLLKLQAQGRIALPALRESKRRAREPVRELIEWREPSLWEGTLHEIRPVRLEVVQCGSPAAARWAYWLDHYHYLGLRVVGQNIGYLAYGCQDRELACLLFGAPAWRCRARDQFLQWTSEQRRRQLERVSNNSRFLILPWIRVAHLASHLLGQVVRRIRTDWQAKYGQGLDWLETFVDTQRYSGTCYRAANWQAVGLTSGRTRQDRHHQLKVCPKAIYLYRLDR
jgi:hypothetical protein